VKQSWGLSDMRKRRTEESRQWSRARANAYWADPSRRQAHGEKTRDRMNRPEVRAKIAERTKEALADPEVRERQRSAQLSAMADPAVRLRISERTKAGLAAKKDRQFADLLKVWSVTPDNVLRKFVAYTLESWSP
jgi:hypothetical protein